MLTNMHPCCHLITGLLLPTHPGCFTAPGPPNAHGDPAHEALFISRESTSGPGNSRTFSLIGVSELIIELPGTFSQQMEIFY